jgi:hypothetical protein
VLNSLLTNLFSSRRKIATDMNCQHNLVLQMFVDEGRFGKVHGSMKQRHLLTMPLHNLCSSDHSVAVVYRFGAPKKCGCVPRSQAPGRGYQATGDRGQRRGREFLARLKKIISMVTTVPGKIIPIRHLSPPLRSTRLMLSYVTR